MFKQRAQMLTGSEMSTDQISVVSVAPSTMPQSHLDGTGVMNAVVICLVDIIQG